MHRNTEVPFLTHSVVKICTLIVFDLKYSLRKFIAMQYKIRLLGIAVFRGTRIFTSRRAAQFAVCRAICCLLRKNAELPVFLLHLYLTRGFSDSFF